VPEKPLSLPDTLGQQPVQPDVVMEVDEDVKVANRVFLYIVTFNDAESRV